MVKIHPIEIRTIPSETRSHYLAHGSTPGLIGAQKRTIMKDLCKNQEKMIKSSIFRENFWRDMEK